MPRADRASRDRRPIVNLSFDISQPTAKALRALRDTGLFGRGDCASVAEELLRRALLAPGVFEYWRSK